MKILTYNINRATDENNKNTLSKILNYLKEKDFDVICLQEVIYPIFTNLKVKLKNGWCICCKYYKTRTFIWNLHFNKGESNYQ